MKELQLSSCQHPSRHCQVNQLCGHLTYQGVEGVVLQRRIINNVLGFYTTIFFPERTWDGLCMVLGGTMLNASGL